MKKLTRYTTFEALKADVQSGDATSETENRRAAEFENFLNLLRKELLLRKKAKNDKNVYGK